MLGCCLSQGPGVLKTSPLLPPSGPRKATFQGGRESDCAQREDLNITPRRRVSGCGAVTSAPSLSQDPLPHPTQGEAMPAKGTYQEFIHSHPTPFSVQVMPSVWLSHQQSRGLDPAPLGLCDAPVTSQPLPCPALLVSNARGHVTSQGHLAISEDSLAVTAGGCYWHPGGTAKHPTMMHGATPSTQKCPAQAVCSAHCCNRCISSNGNGPHCAGKETGAQRCCLTCPKSHSL